MIEAGKPLFAAAIGSLVGVALRDVAAGAAVQVALAIGVRGGAAWTGVEEEDRKLVTKALRWCETGWGVAGCRESRRNEKLGEEFHARNYIGMERAFVCECSQTIVRMLVSF